MKAFSFQRKHVIGAACVATVMLFAAIAGCAPEQAPQTDAAPAEATDATAEGTMAGYAEMFPLQYASLQQERTDENGIVKGHSIGQLRDICEAPLARDQNGDVLLGENGTVTASGYAYDEELGMYVLPEQTDEQLKETGLYSGCVACKSSKFNDIYAQQGASAFGSVYNKQAREIVNGEYFDCAMCHDGMPSADNLKANLVYFNALGDDFAANLVPKLAVCAQCHNSYDYRSRITTEADLENFRPYRYGTDLESVFKASYEDGVNFAKDEETGISTSYMVHPIIEIFQTSPMANLGVTCVDCHMPKTTDAESGTTYTNHFAANNPLENEDSLEYCLTCHKNQGIETTADMKAYAEQKADELARGYEELTAQAETFKAALEEAIKTKSKDEATLDKARELYAKASWYDHCINTQPSVISVGHMASMVDGSALVEAGEKACSEGMALIA
ncbi:ammonia-forming cytochrome c nitrite reductase subunit c552 [Adlercreutzia sp. R21]|uniref:nitrite reductase (cytochrome; ammonia-forming) n=1 Tax=Adlercreutzia wanghongyangiae TaxID=3111451 RepID=A0ABU6IFC1_9ACTN|nr:ammonia-forming cytochrome c nitrite reductase subunit c552 [Adlercreutzia sp. R21]MEC4175086.1 ammonia-forming cytochrome c nitrite reductase subunit c552 [Adlercreutzia sp. R7]MEC4184241.1 ammonia-forming cytochrome c nitrite reductase subunit c552 [Adlercreutzia sp. R21]